MFELLGDIVLIRDWSEVRMGLTAGKSVVLVVNRASYPGIG